MSDAENSEIVAKGAAPEGDERKMTVVEASAAVVTDHYRLAQFNARPMLLTQQPFPHYEMLHDDAFARIAYPLLGGVTRGRIKDVQAYVGAMADDLTLNNHLILFGTEDAIEGYYHSQAQTVMWDARTLEARNDTDFHQAVWRSPYGAIQSDQRIPFIMQLAGNDVGLYDDIMQSIAPMIMDRKPDGVVWWVGDGANGKSTLMDALYEIFPGQLSSLTVRTLTDKVDTPFLNGNLANIVKESSEGRIEDTEIYKAIGTHKNFRVHKFHSQGTWEINGNMHHIFSANTIPTFNDKGYSARRRTFIIPFTQRFESDPLFKELTFTPEMFGRLIYEMMKYAKEIAARGYRYKWSAQTLSAKLDYDSTANNSEEYAKHIIHSGLVAFESFNPIRMDYENWCADEGYVPLGLHNLTRSLKAAGFERVSVRSASERIAKMYRLDTNKVPGELIPLGMGKPGMYTIQGFRPADMDDLDPPIPDFPEAAPEVEEEPEKITVEEPPEPPAPPAKSVLNNRW